MQAKFKKDQLDKVREEQNTDAATGEVLCHCPLVFAAWSGQFSCALSKHAVMTSSMSRASTQPCCTNVPVPLAWQEERGQRRLQFLLKQAEVFQHFAPAASEKEKKCGSPLPALHAKDAHANPACSGCAHLLQPDLDH